MKYFKKDNILAQQHYIPIYKFSIFKDKYLSKNSKVYYNSSVSLPIYCKLSLKEQNYIIRKIKEFFNYKK